MPHQNHDFNKFSPILKNKIARSPFEYKKTLTFYVP